MGKKGRRQIKRERETEREKDQERRELILRSWFLDYTPGE
jgi:hypothetical protein